MRQSERFDLYSQEFERLKAAGRVYACYETPEELELRRKVLLGRGLPPVYERKPADAPVPEGRAPHWRFKLDHDAPIGWTDSPNGVLAIVPEPPEPPGALPWPVARVLANNTDARGGIVRATAGGLAAADDARVAPVLIPKPTQKTDCTTTDYGK